MHRVDVVSFKVIFVWKKIGRLTTKIITTFLGHMPLLAIILLSVPLSGNLQHIHTIMKKLPNGTVILETNKQDHQHNLLTTYENHVIQVINYQDHHHNLLTTN